MIRLLSAFAIFGCQFAYGEIPKTLAANPQTSPYDVVVPMLYGDPNGASKVSGQLYFDVLSGAFKGVDNGGNVTTFATGTNIINGVTAGTGLTGGGTSGNVTLNVNAGNGANQIVQLDGSAKLPAIDGSQLLNLPVVGANTALSNLTNPTAINQNLIPSGAQVDRDVNSPVGDSVNDIGFSHDKVVGQLIPAATMTVTAAQFHINGSPAGGLFAVQILSDSSGTPGSVLYQSDFLPAGTYNGVVTLNFSSPITLTAGTTYWVGISSVYGTSVGSYFSVQYSAASSGYTGYAHTGSWATTTAPAFALTAGVTIGSSSHYWDQAYISQLNLGTAGIISAPTAIQLNAAFLTLPTGTTDPTAPAGSVYYNSSTNKIRWYNGSTWADL